MQSTDYMRRALLIAENGLGYVAPNPLVGAVIVKDNVVLGEGWHAEYGHEHAEVAALNDAKQKGSDVAGATLYCTLEPCNHTGKQSPCTQAIINAKIAKVIYAANDTNSVAKGGGEYLKSVGVEVESGVCESEAKWQNRVFFNWVNNKRPYVCVKVAVSSDNNLCARAGERTAITGDIANEYTHKLRQWLDAILVGGNTVAVDNPSLTARPTTIFGKPRNPLRVIIDGLASIPLTSTILETPGTLVLTTNHANIDSVTNLRKKAEVEVVQVENKNITVTQILEILYKRGITSVLVEGGAKILEQFLHSNCVDEWVLIKSPKQLPGGLQFLENPDSLPNHFALREKIVLGADTAYVYIKK